ncbi:protein MICROTUBULE BINDING PROTEIN 2C [Ziziphus jujuba]|uniref:Protein MICROTUBULE BINDING PROTEIN 2C n=1 Tax=Ziziphus jujuba TaxID=326968 RepID=A0A6P3ZU88_ZIZJJ|nr:protein MICROTUBULE BINDING PROTEIN 2C [Ziziphus jujuba]
MYEQQHFVDLQDNGSGYGDPNSWLSGESNSSPTHHRTQSSLSAVGAGAGVATNANLDRVLFNDLVEIVPLVQSLIDRKASSSFTRRGSMVYTKTPSRESLSKKITEVKGRNAAQSIPARKKKDHGDKDQGKNGCNDQDAENFSIFSSRALAADKDREELDVLRGQVEDLQRKLSEKDELLKSAEVTKNQLNAVHAKLNELNHQAGEKDSLIRSTQQQLSDAKIKLADKQAALEKIQWEAMTSGTKVEKLQEELNLMRGEISSFMMVFEGLMKTNTTVYAEDYDVLPCNLDHLPPIDDLDGMEMQKMEEARQAYIAAVAAAKKNQDEESIVAAAKARLHLQSFVFRT